MDNLYLFAILAGTRVAVEAGEVEAVVKLTDISPCPAWARMSRACPPCAAEC